MAKYLDQAGLTKLWSIILARFAEKGGTEESIADVLEQLNAFKNTAGKAGGLAQLDSGGKVPSSQLPAYVDDVLEYDNKTAFPESGQDGVIYVAEDTNLTYRWSGTAYVEISPSLALGETSSTAYPGNKGKANADAIALLRSDLDNSTQNFVNHKNNKQNPHGVTASQVGLGNVDNTSDANKPISTATQTALNNKLDKLVDGKYSFTELAKGISLEAFENFVGTFIEVAQDHLYIANSNVYYSFGNSASDKLKFNSEDNQYEVLDESMALTATEIEAICV